jgi:hypothetical protein
VNSLVEDLSLELYGLSEVRTFHSYARGLLSEMLGSAKVFPKLSEVIREDAKLALGREVNFDGNPKTGVHVAVDKQLVPFFKTGKEMRKRLNRVGT